MDRREQDIVSFEWSHLHVHSDYSNIRLIDSINKIPMLIDRAVEIGCCGIAITDHESISGHIQAIQYVKEGKKNGKIPQEFKLILGNEIYLVDNIEEEEGRRYCKTPYYHFILLAKDEVGHEQLRLLSSMAWKNSFNTGKMTRVPTLKEDLESVVKDNKGHLIASTACIGGELGSLILNDRIEECEEFVKWCYGLFEDDFYLEMQPSDNEEQILVNSIILGLSEKYKVPYIITTDAHYLTKEDRIFHSAYLKSHEEERETDEFYMTTYMMDEKEIHEYMDQYIGVQAVNKGLKNTGIITSKVEEYDLFHSQIVPKIDLPSFTLRNLFKNYYKDHEYIEKFVLSDNENDRYLLHLIEEGFIEKEINRGVNKDYATIDELVDRIELELKAIWLSSERINDKVSSYYICTLKILDIMWDDKGGNSLVGPGRGSVASFYTGFLINLHQINPIKYQIPYWRHLHESRPEMPKQHWACKTS